MKGISVKDFTIEQIDKAQSLLEDVERAERELNNFMETNSSLQDLETVRVLQEEIMAMINGKGLFGDRFNKNLQLQGFVKDCPTCCYNASNDYACGRKNE